jgi:hypothetical protein
MIKHYFTLFITLACIPLYAQTITVLNDTPGSRVFLNGVFVGEGTVTKFPTDPGDYQVTIKSDNETIFSERAMVGVGENTVVNANTFIGSTSVPSTVINYGSKQVEEKRLRKTLRGKLGLGGQWNPFGSGFSIRFHPIDRWGIQGIGWLSTDNNREKSTLRGRLTYDLEDTLLSVDQLAVVYVGIGLGKKSDNYSSDPDYGSFTATNTDETALLEAFIGADFSFGGRTIFWNIEAGFVQAERTKTAFSGSASTKTERNGFVSLGAHIYFN